MLNRKHPTLLLLPLLIMMGAGAAIAQSTAFTYQGRLTDGGTAANGNYDLQFTLWDGLSNGNQIGLTQTLSTVAVSSGIFTVQLDFGASAFPGANRWLEMSARPSSGGAFTLLSPRQQVTSTPYAIRSLNASSADTVIVSGVPSGSGNYVQNSTTQQSANFNISGNGTAGGTVSADAVSANTQFNINGERVLIATGPDNLFAGIFAGSHNTASGNSFFGRAAGFSNTNGCCNSFFGKNSGLNNASGQNNSFFGYNAGASSLGSNNSFIGTLAGQANQTGSSNTTVGAFADLNANNLTNATAIGANALVSENNSLVLGSINGVNGATASVNVGIGTNFPGRTLQVVGDFGVLVPVGTSETTIGSPNAEAGMSIRKVLFGRADVRFDGSTLKLVTGPDNGVPPAATNGIAINTAGNVGIGTSAPKHRLSLVGGPLWTSASWTGAMEIGNASAIGWQQNAAGWHFGIGQTTGGLLFFQTSSDLGSTLSPANYLMMINDGGMVGIGTVNPDRLLTVNGGASKSGGGSWDVFSDERLKNIKGRFTPGLKALMQLQPLRYEYKRDNALGIKSEGEHVGFGAQAVQKIIPEAVTKDDKGYLLVNNDPIMWTMLNAIKEQQTQIEQQRNEIAQQQQQIADLRSLVCRSHRRSSICK